MEALIAASYLSHDSHIDGAIFGMRRLELPVEVEAWPKKIESAVDHKSGEESWMKACSPSVALLGYTFQDQKKGLDVLVRLDSGGYTDDRAYPAIPRGSPGSRDTISSEKRY